MRRGLAMLGVVLWLGGCNGRSAGPPRELARVPQVTEPPRPIDSAHPTATAKRALGESCDEGAWCESGICLKVDASIRSGGSVCSLPCQDAPCLAGWACVQVFPAQGNEFCVPEARQ